MKSIVKKLKIPFNEVDCYPLMWFQLNTKISEEFKVYLKQSVAFKYAVIKMIDRRMTSGSSQQANIDMYPVEFLGIELPIPDQDVINEKAEDED